MRVKAFYLEAYDWEVVMMFDAGSRHAVRVAEALEDIGAAEQSVRRAEEMISEGRRDIGMTYSNINRRQSVMVIGKTSSAAEFANTYYHEIGHLVRHIAEACEMDPRGEEEQYLAGAVCEKSFPLAEGFMCSCCRGE